MARDAGPSVRLRLALSYAGFLMVAGTALLAVVWVFLLRYVPDQASSFRTPDPGSGPVGPGLYSPGRSDLWEAFAPKAAMMLGVLLVLGLVGGWLLAGRMLAPLHRLTEATRAVGEGSLSHRIGLPGRNDEFRELADAFDSMTARLEAHVGEQRRFAANASHELRTPLATTQALLEVAREDPARLDRDLVDVLHGVNARAIALTEALLLLGRAERGSFAREPVDLSLVAEEVAETLLPLAERQGTVLSAAGDVAHVLGSPALLLQMVTNLVHNAVVHNLPEGGWVRVATAVRARTVLLAVENTGEPLDPTAAATLVEPFRRGTERVHATQAGVGLGLAIVRAIAEAHEGTLAVEPRPEGGLRVTVELPRGPRLDA